MKLIKELLESPQSNAYFTVNRPFAIWLFQKTQPSGHYYGSSQYHQPVYKKATTAPGDQIHWLHGGLFYVPANETKAYRLRLEPPGDFSPFEKKYSYSDPVAGQLAELRDDDNIMLISKQQAKNVSYG